MEVKIGVTHANRELTLDLSKNADDIQKAVTAALDGDSSMLVLTDDKGRTVFVPIEKLAYVELVGDTGRRMGFGV